MTDVKPWPGDEMQMCILMTLMSNCESSSLINQTLQAFDGWTVMRTHSRQLDH